MASIRVAAVGSTATRAAASALVTSGADGGEASVRAVSEGRVSGDDVGRFVLTGPDPPFLPESHQIPSRRLYPGSALANAGTGTGAGQKPRVRRQPRSGPFTADANTNGTSARCEPASRDSVPTRVPAGTALTQQGIEVTDDAVDRQRGLRLSNDLGEDGQSHGGLRQDDEV